MKAASGGRIKEIRAKIAVLDPTAADESPKPTRPGSGAKASDAKPAAATEEVKGS